MGKDDDDEDNEEAYKRRWKEKRVPYRYNPHDSAKPSYTWKGHRGWECVRGFGAHASE